MDYPDDGQGGSVSMMAQEALEKAKTAMSVSQLRDADSKATKLLGDITAGLCEISDLRRAQQWIESIGKLQGENQMPRFVIGVLGDTGSGKSSLINAVLDEERVVPTNCMRACTAVITEISWNISEDSTKKYRAEIEFITQAEWTKEVLTLHRDIIDSDGRLSADIHNPDTDAGNAYAILKAVYPGHTNEMLRETDSAVLANYTKVREVTGRTILVEEEKCDKFYSGIQAYVDSEEKQGKKADDTPPKEPTMAFWPLIKVVRVFLKSEILSTGVVLVDLPGGRDSNAARAAVAGKYVKECSRLWIVAPITRAVDDKTAKTLLGDNFKQQLKYDSSYTNITFICTKADDISIDEAAFSLGIEDFIAHEQQQSSAMKLDIDVKKQELKSLETEKKSLHIRQKMVSSEFKTWRGLHLQTSNGTVAYAPFASPSKRKRQTATLEKQSDGAANVKKEPLSSETEEDSSDSDMNADDLDEPECLSKPLTAEETLAKVDELKALKKTIKNERNNIGKQISQLKASIKKLNINLATTKTSMYQECIRGRNIYSRAAIKQDFAFGMKEFDDEILADSQEDTQQLQADQPDYNKIGQDLPVFCISSRGYQQLRGRMKKDRRVAGFVSLDDTEIPALREHTLELANRIQVRHFKHHMSEISRLLGMMDLFIAGDMASTALSSQEKEAETQYLQKSLEKLGTTLGELLSTCMKECRSIVKKNIIKRTREGVLFASAKAINTAKGWGAKPDAGGLRFMTYRATCRRGGVFKGVAGLRDFNEELLKPLKNHTAYQWDQVFNKRIPEKLERFAASCKQLIDAFNERMKGRRFLAENGDLVQNIVAKHLAGQNETLAHMAAKHLTVLKNNQRDASRLFYPAILGVMQPAYDICTQQTGVGALMALKGIMESHVESSQNTMFKNAANKVDNAVNETIKSLDVIILQDLNSIISTMDEDYSGLIGAVVTEADNRARKTLGPVLRSFYQNLLLALTAVEEDEAVIESCEVDYVEQDDGDSSYHDSD
ncbi:Nuclear GTPase SLIP-GC 4 [Colletotrichum truncatum]|uniref:Nuclear GTPase SLIP-GC 4 n=1 Tax=Colletotrichum truncatum TaxID=5467 RepID=A0ACC3YG40_COLTU|nr:Nuclear GTPase SLIP-GC 4 [Colletotrichum truncatum]KAF6784481.1 Nuclear GTPase SLIP-GC 4 [Colletotrichum truncatum]